MKQSESIVKLSEALVAANSVGWYSLPYASKYMIGDAGDVITTHNSPRLMRPSLAGYGYRKVTIVSDSGKHLHKYVHDLVTEAFIGQKGVGLEVRHLDGNRENNSIENLCYGTRKENEADKVRHGTTHVGERNPMSVLTIASVKEIRDMAGGVSQAEIARIFGVSPMTVSRIVRRESWRSV